jgi:hypothetical protein
MSSTEKTSSSHIEIKESEKLYFDSVKHLTTLSTGSIVLFWRLFKDICLINL